MRENLIKDLSVVTTISEQHLNKVFDKVEYCICDAIDRANKDNDQVSEIDLYFGILKIFIGNDEIKYKFQPSERLEKYILKTLDKGKNTFISRLETTLVSKIENVYKNLI